MMLNAGCAVWGHPNYDYDAYVDLQERLQEEEKKIAANATYRIPPYILGYARRIPVWGKT